MLTLQTQGPYFESQASKAKLYLGCPGPLSNSKGERHLEPGDWGLWPQMSLSRKFFLIQPPLLQREPLSRFIWAPRTPVVGIIAWTLSSLLRRLFSQLGSQIFEDRRCFVHFALALTKHLVYVDPKERPLNRCIDESSIPLPSLSAQRPWGTVYTHHSKETGNGECPNVFTETHCFWTFKNITDITW